MNTLDQLLSSDSVTLHVKFEPSGDLKTLTAVFSTRHLVRFVDLSTFTHTTSVVCTKKTTNEWLVSGAFSLSLLSTIHFITGSLDIVLSLDELVDFTTPHVVVRLTSKDTTVRIEPEYFHLLPNTSFKPVISRPLPPLKQPSLRVPPSPTIFSPDSVYTSTFTVTRQQMSHLIGVNGTRITAIRSKCQCHIKVLPLDKVWVLLPLQQTKFKPQQIELTGTAEGIASAKYLIKKCLEDLQLSKYKVEMAAKSG